MNLTSSRTVQAAVLTLISVGLIVLALGGYLTPLTRIIANPIVSAQTWLSTRYQTIHELLTSPSDINRLKQRNLELEAEISRLQTQVIDLQGQVTEVQILSALVDFARSHPENKYLAASVISYDPSPFMRYVIINRGSDDGLRRGMPVVTYQGLVGRVAAVSAGAARIQLITDPGSYVNVRLKPSQAEAALKGTVTGDVVLDNIPQDITVQAGDLVLTSGIGGSYPSNLIIGQVSGVKSRESDLFQTASVQLVVDFTKLDIVLVITNFNPVDITPLIP